MARVEACQKTIKLNGVKRSAKNQNTDRENYFTLRLNHMEK